VIRRKRGKAEAVKEKVDQVDTLPPTHLVLSFTNHFVAFNYRNLEPRQLEPKMATEEVELLTNAFLALMKTCTSTAGERSRATTVPQGPDGHFHPSISASSNSSSTTGCTTMSCGVVFALF